MWRALALIYGGFRAERSILQLELTSRVYIYSLLIVGTYWATVDIEKVDRRAAERDIFLKREIVNEGFFRDYG